MQTACDHGRLGLLGADKMGKTSDWMQQGLGLLKSKEETTENETAVHRC